MAATCIINISAGETKNEADLICCEKILHNNSAIPIYSKH